MNHDYAHCSDYQPSCPQSCFRGELVRDLINHPHLPVSWMHLEGTADCQKTKRKTATYPDWIPCSERNPDKIGTYLVTSQRGSVYMQRWESYGWGGRSQSCIAWMPLPKPYKEKEE